MVKARTVTASPNTLYSCAVYSGIQLLFSTISLTSFFTFSASQAVFMRNIYHIQHSSATRGRLRREELRTKHFFQSPRRKNYDIMVKAICAAGRRGHCAG